MEQPKGPQGPQSESYRRQDTTAPRPPRTGDTRNPKVPSMTRRPDKIKARRPNTSSYPSNPPHIFRQSSPAPSVFSDPTYIEVVCATPQPNPVPNPIYRVVVAAPYPYILSQRQSRVQDPPPRSPSQSTTDSNSSGIDSDDDSDADCLPRLVYPVMFKQVTYPSAIFLIPTLMNVENTATPTPNLLLRRCTRSEP